MLESTYGKHDYFELAAARSQYLQLGLVKSCLQMWCLSEGTLTVAEVNDRLSRLGWYGTVKVGIDLRPMVMIHIYNGVWVLSTFANTQILHIPVGQCFISPRLNNKDDRLEIRSICEILEDEQHSVLLAYLRKVNPSAIVEDFLLDGYQYCETEDIFEYAYRRMPPKDIS